MSAGGKGDEPYLDIVIYKTRVFSEKADDLVRDLNVLMNSSEILEFRSELMKIMFEHLDINELESQLEARKNQLIARAIQNGLDLELLESEMLRQKQGKVS
ncbi:hypothetical protein ANAEL_02261 [Anaerolineales bacterium]|nr:hypothetical protein ANAEL_02261 [Anaerolineales bacterium]